MTSKKTAKKPKKKRQPPLKIPLSFHQAVTGVLGLSVEDAKKVRAAGKAK